MEKFFISILDIIKYHEVRAQEKSECKKYWVLGNQYLQPVDDVEDEKKCLAHNLKKKVHCVYQAARWGMKEGVLTGIFLGGFYGVIKNLNENIGNALMSSSLSKVNSSEEVKDQYTAEKNLPGNENDNRNPEQSSNNNHHLQSDFREQTLMRDSALKNKKRGKSTFTKSEKTDRSNNIEPKVERRPNSAGQSANENLFSFENVRPNTVMNVDNNRLKSREREKVKLIGYAFVQTFETKNSESSGNSSSDEYDRKIGDSKKKEDDSKLQNRSEPKGKVNSDQSGRSSGSNYPKNVLASIQEVHRKKKVHQKDTDHSTIEQTKLSTSSSSSQESYPVQVLRDTRTKRGIEDNRNEKRNTMKQTKTKEHTETDKTDEKNSGNQRDMKRCDQSTIVRDRYKPESDKGKFGCNKGTKKNVMKGSGFGFKAREIKDSKSKRSKSKNRFSKSERGTILSKHRKSDVSNDKSFNAFYENFFVPSKISKSVLIDADVISNGYSLSLNNESLNSNEDFDSLTESNFNVTEASRQKIRHIIEQPKTSFKDDDTISYHSQKKLTFVEPEILPLSDNSLLHLEPSTTSFMRLKEDNSHSESIDSIASDTKLGQANHTNGTEHLNKPVSVQSVQSLTRTLGDNQPVLDQSAKPSDKSTAVGSARSAVVSGHTSPKAISIGDSTATSFVQNDGSLNKQSKELRNNKNNDMKIVGSEFNGNKVRSVKEKEFSGTPRSDNSRLKNVSDSLILLSACNCAVVLGVLCAVISTTKASLSF